MVTDLTFRILLNWNIRIYTLTGRSAVRGLNCRSVQPPYGSWAHDPHQFSSRGYEIKFHNTIPNLNSDGIKSGFRIRASFSIDALGRIGLP